MTPQEGGVMSLNFTTAMIFPKEMKTMTGTGTIVIETRERRTIHTTSQGTIEMTRNRVIDMVGRNPDLKADILIDMTIMTATSTIHTRPMSIL